MTTVEERRRQTKTRDIATPSFPGMLKHNTHHTRHYVQVKLYTVSTNMQDVTISDFLLAFTLHVRQEIGRRISFFYNDNEANIKLIEALTSNGLTSNSWAPSRLRTSTGYDSKTR
jgi:hypothetical protein